MPSQEFFCHIFLDFLSDFRVFFRWNTDMHVRILLLIDPHDLARLEVKERCLRVVVVIIHINNACMK